MSRALTFSLFALALFVGTTGGAQSVHAVSCVGDNSGAAGTCTASSACLPTTRADSAVGTCSATEVCCSATNIEFSGGNAQTIASDAKTVTKVSTGPVMNSYLAQFMNWVASLFAWLLGVAALMLDYSVHYTVVTMGEYVKNLTAVGVTWQILRDIGNILLIFGFLAIGVTTILNVDWYGGGKKMLPMLLVGAVFLNFSLFFTQAIIDVGNLFATQFYTQINGGQPSKAKNEGDFMQTVTNEGISNKLMNQLGLTQIYNAARTENGLLRDGNSIFIGFMSIIVFLIAAFVMFSLAFILIARFVILLFLIILAPIGFAGLAIPQMKKVAGLWWHKLFEQTITAPILLLLLYIALAVITDTKFLSFGGAGKWTGFAPGSSGAITDLTGFGSMVLSFLVAMGLLLAVVMVSKSLSAFGAGQAMKWGGRLTFGATALGASAVVGGGAFALRRGVVQRFTPRSRFGIATQRLLSRGLRATEGVRMDIRRVPGVGAGLTALNAGEAAAPIAQSAVGRMTQASQWIRHGGDAANAQMAQETRIPRLIAAVRRGDRATALGLMRSVTDDELRSRDLQNLITSNPLAPQVLTNHQVALLPDNILTNPMVYQNLSVTQLEAYRAAGNGAPRNAAMEAYISANQYGLAYLGLRTPVDQATIRAFWNI